MRQVIFKRISIQNFLSVGEDTININFKKGINCIKGVNLDKENQKNGVGKSTMAEAVYFALFGKTIRDIKTNQIVHFGCNDPCVVKLWYDITEGESIKKYELVRMAGPSKVFLTEDDVDITKSTIPKTNEHIKNLLNVTPEVFANSILLDANLSTPFMSQKKTEKRKFLEGILGLEVFGEMLLLARQHHNETKNEYSVEYATFQEKNKAFKNISDIYKSYEENKEGRKNELLERIAGVENKISALEKENKELESKIEKYKSIKSTQEIDEKISQLQKAHHQLISNIASFEINKKNLEKQIVQLENESDVCSTCGAKLAKEAIENKKESKEKIKTTIDEIENKISKQKEKLEKINSNIDKIRESRDKILEKRSNLQHLKNAYSKNINSVENFNHNIANIKKDIENLNTQDKIYENQISELQIEIDKLSASIDALENRLNIYQVAKMIVSEEGIRSYIVTKVLKILNSRLAYYLNKLDANSTCKFDKYFNEQMTDYKGRECGYFSFSAGERKRIDLAMLFTFQDLRRLQAKCSLNLSMYDELLDSSLDEVGINKTLQILKEHSEKYNECVYIITHRQDATFEITGEEINLEKKNGVTRLAI